MTSFFSVANVNASDNLQFGTYTPDQFHDYWYNQGAEISCYALQQARYGEIHDGDAVLVFVTEPMNPAIQVKADQPGPQNVPVLKLNAVRKFFTGTYPYSVMTSIFTRVDTQTYPLPLKITTSVQEWCSHVYTQMNLRDDAYCVRMQSYFEKEGDQDFSLEKDLPEDAIWTMIRIAPKTLPQGTFSMIPGTVYVRLLHRLLKAQKVIATLSQPEGKSLESNALVRYEINFPEEQRTLRIDFEQDFPYRIHKWEDSYPGLSGMSANVLTTSATRTHTMMDAYWQHHGKKRQGAAEKTGTGREGIGKELNADGRHVRIRRDAEATRLLTMNYTNDSPLSCVSDCKPLLSLPPRHTSRIISRTTMKSCSLGKSDKCLEPGTTCRNLTFAFLADVWIFSTNSAGMTSSDSAAIIKRFPLYTDRMLKASESCQLSGTRMVAENLEPKGRSYASVV